MPIRAIDIRRKEFRNGFRGYDANQVDDFLDTVADEFERTYNENQRMREETNGLRERLQQFEDLEGSIRAALVHAEQAANDLRRSANREAEDVRENARREAEFTVREAQNRSHQMLADSSSRIERVQDSYEALQDAKKSFSNDFRHLLKTYMDMMENMEVSSAREMEDSLRERLDTESVAVVREAAREEPSEPEEPAFGATGDAADLEDPGSTQRIEPETAASEDQDMQATGPLTDQPLSDDAAAEEQETQVIRSGDSTTTDQPEGSEGEVVWSVEAPGPDEPADESGAGQPGPSAVGEPRASEEVEREEPTLAEEKSSHEFFDRESSAREGGEGRISRASRFLRRRE